MTCDDVLVFMVKVFFLSHRLLQFGTLDAATRSSIVTATDKVVRIVVVYLVLIEGGQCGNAAKWSWAAGWTTTVHG